MNSAVETIGQFAGIGGFSLGVLLLVFRDVIKKNIFPNLSRQQAYNILRLVIVFTFLIATFGIAAWVWSDTMDKNMPKTGQEPTSEEQDFRRIYYQGFDSVPDQSELNNMWIRGQSGDWEGSFSDGVHRLCNISTSESASFTSAFSYFTTENKKVDLSDSKVSVKVKIIPPNGKYSSVGILFRKDRTKPNYYAFVLNPGNSVSLMLRQGNSLGFIWTKEIGSKIQNSVDVKLSMIGKGTELQLYVNDEMIDKENDIVLEQGNPGVFAYSKGCFVFDDFSLYQ